jgi:uncharacterized protein (TIGR02145 family)
MRKMIRPNRHIAGIGICLLAFVLLSSGSINRELAKSSTEITGFRIQPCRWNGKTTFVDPRDQRVYYQVEIGGRCWMASNLHFGSEVPNMEQTDNQKPEFTCYANDPQNCNRYGGLYTWAEAMNYAKPEKGTEIQGLCPYGWHLPSDAEWTAMEQAIDPTIATERKDWRGKTLGNRLIAAADEWIPAALPESPCGFDALPAGSAVSGWFFYLGRGAYFWTSSPYSAAAAWSRGILSQTAQVFRGPGDQLAGFSVRCIKNL